MNPEQSNRTTEFDRRKSPFYVIKFHQTAQGKIIIKIEQEISALEKNLSKKEHSTI